MQDFDITNSSPASSLWWDNSDNLQGFSPEQRLWAAVLIVLVNDVQSAYNKWRASLNGHREEFYLNLYDLIELADNDHIEMICEFVEINHEVFMNRLERIATGFDYVPKTNRSHY